MRAFEDTLTKAYAAMMRHTKPGAKLRKAGHNIVAIFLVAVLSVWQTPAIAFAAPDDGGAEVAAAAVEEPAADAGSDAAEGQADEPAEADQPTEGDGQQEEPAAEDPAPEQPQPEDQTPGSDASQPEGADGQDGQSSEPATQDEPAADGTDQQEASEAAETEELPGQDAEELAGDEQAETWTITFDGNGGWLRDGDKTIRNITEDTKVKLPKQPYEREGYTFIGWNTAPDPKAPGVDPQKALFVPDNVELLNLQYRFVILTEENASESELEKAIETTDDKKIAIYPTTKDNLSDTRDSKGRTIHGYDLSTVAKKKTIKLYAQWKENPKDEASEPEEEGVEAVEGAEYSHTDDTEAVVLEGEAAQDPEVARDRLSQLDGIDDEEAASILDELTAQSTEDGEEGEAADGEGEEGEDADGEGGEEEPPSSLDGSNIDSIAAKWITKDTDDNGDPSRLYIRPNDDSSQMVLLRINYALSGEYNYGPGEVVITIPTHIFKNRNGAPYGNLTIPYPQAPSTKKEFNWTQIGDNYVITNTREMSAASAGFIEFSIDGLTPHQLVDMQVSDKFSAYIEVQTNQGNTIALRSNELDAQFDTKAELTQVSKRRYSDVQRVKASEIPADKRIEGEDEYLKVSWYMWVSTKANTVYTLDMVDSIPANEVVYTKEDGTPVTEAEAQGFILQATSEDGMTVENDDMYTGSLSGMGTYTYFTSVYPASQFEPDVRYTFHNTVNYTLTEVDPETSEVNPNVETQDGVDPQLVTSGSASATATYSYQLPTWKEPEGHYNVFKNGNDDIEQNGHAKNNYTHNSSRQRSDLHLEENNWYGIYPSALNDLQDIYAEQGTDGGLRLSYTIDTIGYAMPWMFNAETVSVDGEMAPRKSINYTRPITMTTEDTGISIGRTGAKLQVGADYDFVSVEFPNTPIVYYGKPHNINPDGSWEALTAGDGTFTYASDSDKSHWPDIELQVQVGGAWQHWATASWSSGSRVITLADGSTTADGVVNVPEGTQNFRTIVTLKNEATDTQLNQAWQAGIKYDVRPVIFLKSTDSLMSQVEAAFASQKTPSISVWNGTTFDAKLADTNEHIITINKDGYDVMRGYTTDVSVYPYKSSRQTYSDVDYNEGIITIHYTARVEERSIISDRLTYEQAIADGRLSAERHGVWRDLLPLGVSPDIESIKVRDNDRVTAVYTEENYNNSGRTLLVVEVDLTPTPATYYKGDMYYYQDVPTISFDGKYDFDDYKDYGGYFHNVVSFESSNDHIGNVPQYSGEPDNPYGNADGTNGNVSTPQAFDRNSPAEKDAMVDLNPDRDDPSFVYAGVWTSLNLLSAGNLGLSKDVMVNNDGLYSTGVYHGPYATAEEAKAEPELQDGGNKRTVYEGGQYNYRLRTMPDLDTRASDLIFFDSLEDFKAGSYSDGDPNDVIDEGAPTWQGYFRGVDVTQLEEKGCAPVVYYSGTNMAFMKTNETGELVENTAYTDLTDSSIWTKASEWSGSLDDVKSIAIDASKKTDGSDFLLDPLDSGVVIVNMQAPSEDLARQYIAEDAHAYNNVFLRATTQMLDDNGEPIGEPQEGNFIRKDYTKIGLKEYDYSVTKRWSDDNDRDGMRPEIITMEVENDEGQMVETEVYNLPFHLLANGVDTGKVGYPAVEDGKLKFHHLPYTTPEGNKIHYTVVEDEIAGYTAHTRFTENTAIFTNSHTPGRITVEGDKLWEGDEESPEARPESITVHLYKQSVNDEQPVFVSSQTVTPAASASWHYQFTNLLEYESGQKIDYTVKEASDDPKAKSYYTNIDGLEITNTYHPYGDLKVTKSVAETEYPDWVKFPFTFSFTRQVTSEDGGSTETVPIDDELAYDILDEDGQVVESGMLTKEDLTVEVSADQTIHVKDIPEYVTYTVTEGEVAGFTQTLGSNLSGTIKPNETQQAGITNLYSASGQFGPTATKVLNNRLLKNYQFRYNLYKIVEGVDEDGNPSYEELLIDTVSSGKPDTSATVTRDDGTIESSMAPINFSMLNFTEDDENETYYYVMREAVPDDAVNGDGVIYADATDEQKQAGGFAKNGYTYDAAEYYLRIAIVDNGDGTLTVTPTYYQLVQHETLFGLIKWEEQEELSADEPRVFENTYEATGSVVPRAWKTVKGGHAEAGEFEFELVDQNGEVLQVKPNDELGAVEFDALEYDETDIGKTYEYTIREVAGDEAGVNYDTSIWRYVVTVDDHGDGTLLPSTSTQHLVLQTDDEGNPVLDDEGNPVYAPEGEANQAPLFTNTLQPGSLKVAKAASVVDPDNPDQEFAFTVHLLGDEVATLEEFEDVQDWEANAETGMVSFVVNLKAGEDRVFEGIPAGTSYQVYEDNPEGWAILQQEGVSGEITALNESTATITNKFQPEVAQAAFFGTKLLDGRPAAPESFTFKLTADEDTPLPEDTEVTVGEGGFIQFGPIEYEKRDLGEETSKDFVYTISEVDPEDPNIDYDMHEETVTVHVELHEVNDGYKMSARVIYDDDGVSFVNQTRPGHLRITKVAEHSTEANADDIFRFRVKLSNESGMPLGSGDVVYWYAADTASLPPVDGPQNQQGGASAGDADGSGASDENAQGAGDSPAVQQQAASSVARSITQRVNAASVATAGTASGLSLQAQSTDELMVFAQASDDYSGGIEPTTTEILDTGIFGGGGQTVGGVVQGSVKWTVYKDGVCIIEPVNGVSGSFTHNRNTSIIPSSVASSITKVRVKSTCYAIGSCGHIFDWSNSPANVIEYADLRGMEVSQCTSVYELFDFCRSLTYLDMSTWTPPANCDFTMVVWFISGYYNKLSVMKLSKELRFRSWTTTTGIGDAGRWLEVGSNPERTLSPSQLLSLYQNGNGTDATWVRVGYDTEFRVAFDPNGGTGSADPISGSVATGVVLPSADDLGIHNGDNNFVGWSANPDAVNPDYQAGSLYVGTPGATTTLYAVWVGAEDYLIHYNANGGTCPKQWQRVNGLDVPIETPTPQHPSYTFAGWNTDPSGNGEWIEDGITGAQLGVEPGDTLTLHAIWLTSNQQYYKVEHYRQNLDGNGYSLYEAKRHIGTIGATVQGQYADYTGFTAYPDHPDTIASDTVARNGSTVLELYYNRNHYQVAFDGNGADSGQMSGKQQFYYEEQKSLTTNSYHKRGYIFTGWNTEPDGSGTSYTDCQQVSNLTAVDGATVTLYAQWLGNEDGALTPTNGEIIVECKAGQTIVIPDLPAGTTYTIEEIGMALGWSQKGEIESDADTPVIVPNITNTSTVTNTYKAHGEAQLVAHKVLAGDELASGRFQFQLIDGGGTVLQTVSNEDVDTSETIKDEEGEDIENAWAYTAPVTFDPISYNQDDIGRTYLYTIREVVGSDDGVNYDTHDVTARVTVVDTGAGVLAAQVSYEGGELFTNEMKPATLHVTKTANDPAGVDPDAVFEFTVTLNDAAGNPLAGSYPVTKNGDEIGTVVDGTGTFSLAGGEQADIAGVPHNTTYTVTEAEREGWEQTSKTGDSGLLTANGEATAAFENTHPVPEEKPYDAVGSASLTATKKVEGGVIDSTDEFEFELVDENGDVIQTVGTVNAGSDVTTSSIEFDELSFTAEQVGGKGASKTFVYNLREIDKSEADESVTFDGTNHTVFVTATDDENGSISTEVKYVKSVEDNAHSPEPEAPTTGATAELQVRLTAEEAPSEGFHVGDEVDYSIAVTNLNKKSTGDDGVLHNVTVHDGVSNTTWVIDELKPEESVGFTAKYIIKANDAINGWVTDLVEASYPGSDAATAYSCEKVRQYTEVQPAGDEDAVVFVNEVHRTSVHVSKDWVGDENDQSARPSSIMVDLMANGRVLESHELTAADGWEYTFENLPEGPDYSIQEQGTKGYTSTVTEVAEGSFKVTNTRVPNAKLVFDKYLYGTGQTSGHVFGFTLVEADAEGNPVEGDDAFTMTARSGYMTDGHATVTFDLEDLAVGEYWFLVTEDATSDGILPDNLSYLVNVNVREVVDEAGNAKIVVDDPIYSLLDENGEVITENDPEPAFYNNETSDIMLFANSAAMTGYTGEDGRVSVYPQVQKYLDGSTAALVGGDYSFTLSGGGVNRTQSNDVVGKVAFYDKKNSKGLVFDAAGTYIYTITENIPDGATANGDGTFTKDGIIYDGSTITLTVEVTQDDDAVLHATESYSGMRQGTAPAFYNQTEDKPDVPPAEIEIQLAVDKFDGNTLAYLPGAELVLADSNGNKVDSWTSEGSVHTISNLKAGASYTLIEVKAPDGYHTVSDTEFTVSDDGSGIAITSKEGTTELTGSLRIALYDPPKPLEKEKVEKIQRKHYQTGANSPKTGDDTPILPVVAIALAALLILLIAWRSRRKDDGGKAARGKHAAR